jgi:acid stress-induced BolA-like protein IbaG/YrbA
MEHEHQEHDHQEHDHKECGHHDHQAHDHKECDHHTHDHQTHDHKECDHHEHDHKECDHHTHDHQAHDHKEHDHKEHDHKEHDHNEHDHKVITCDKLEQKIQQNLSGVSFVKAVDLSDGCGGKFEIEIVSEEFRGKPLLAQHRLVHKAIEEERKHIHALTLKTKAP